MEDCGLHKQLTIRLKRGGHGKPFPAQVKALDLSGDLARASKLLLNDSANFRAMELAARLAVKGSLVSALYMIGPDDHEVVKIGYAANPRLRLCELQIGNWHQLSVRGLLWFDGGAGKVEQLVHRAAAEMDIALRGEWIEASISEAAELVLKAARYVNARCYDSDIWLKNWSSRVDALAEVNGAGKRLAA